MGSFLIFCFTFAFLLVVLSIGWTISLKILSASGSKKNEKIKDEKEGGEN